jgi:hypothetical protein
MGTRALGIFRRKFGGLANFFFLTSDVVDVLEGKLEMYSIVAERLFVLETFTCF